MVALRAFLDHNMSEGALKCAILTTALEQFHEVEVVVLMSKESMIFFFLRLEIGGVRSIVSISLGVKIC